MGGTDGNDECVLLADTTEPAEQGAQSSKVHVATGASGVTEMHTSGTGTTGVKIYFDEADGDRWYLRVYLNSADEEVVELVSQSYITNVSTLTV